MHIADAHEQPIPRAGLTPARAGRLAAWRRARWGVGRAIVLGAVFGVMVSPSQAAPPREAGDWSHCWRLDAGTGERYIDPACFYEALIENYRQLRVYRDIARVLQVTERHGEAPMRVETRIGCSVLDGQLRVETAASRWRRALGLDIQPRQSPATREAARSYAIWLAPHMALKFAEEPRRSFRSGVDDELRPTEASVTQDGRLHLELRTTPEDQDEEPATIDLYVNPESMLVERYEGQQRLPGGGSLATTLDITPTLAEPLAEPVAEPGDVTTTTVTAPQPLTAEPATSDAPVIVVPPVMTPRRR